MSLLFPTENRVYIRLTIVFAKNDLCEKMKFKISVYFVTSVHKMILNIVSTKL